MMSELLGHTHLEGKTGQAFQQFSRRTERTGRQVQGAQELELADKYMERCNILPHE